MNDTSALYLAILLPLLGAVLIAALRNHPNLREAATLVTSVVLFANVCWLVASVANGATPRAENILPMPVSGLFLSLELEPLGAMFAAIASGLWIINSLYSIGYMRANKEKHQTRFYICFAIAIAAAMGIALSGDLITLFVFYEVLTLATYPLVAHKQTAEAKAGARTYLLILLSTSVFLLLFAIAWTYDIAGTVAFAQGGILNGRIESWLAPVLLACFAFGIGKAALLPVHLWLPAAMVAPTPVSALLHAVAVVKAGVFTMLKVGVYIFGIDFLEQTGASQWLAWLAGASILYASVRALAQDNLKARLAYSTVSQLSYVTLAMALATPLGALAGALQIAMHAFGKITLFMCAGAIYVASHRTQVSGLNGLARAMPVTFTAFAVGALSIIGAPLLGGFWVKWEIIFAANALEQLVFIIVMIASSMLSLAYFAPVIGRGFFLPPAQASGDADASAPKEAPLLCVLPPSISAIICIILFFQVDALWRFLEPIFESTP
ncbi:MAG: proton-conducting transporter membrane subunit [Hyphomicrobiales bacterium]|nr:proton-conducting transporter membrane subunit [Hyphomicrobiales bacterium]